MGSLAPQNILYIFNLFTVEGDKDAESIIGKIVYYVTSVLYIMWFISAILIFVGIAKV